MKYLTVREFANLVHQTTSAINKSKKLLPYRKKINGRNRIDRAALALYGVAETVVATVVGNNDFDNGFDNENNGKNNDFPKTVVSNNDFDNGLIAELRAEIEELKALNTAQGAEIKQLYRNIGKLESDNGRLFKENTAFLAEKNKGFANKIKDFIFGK